MKKRKVYPRFSVVMNDSIFARFVKKCEAKKIGKSTIVNKLVLKWLKNG